MQAYFEHNLIEIAIKSLGYSGVRICNHIEYDRPMEVSIYDFAVEEVIKFVATFFPNEEAYGATYREITGTLIHGGFIKFPSAELAQKFFLIFNVSGKTYASGLYAELYIDGNLVSENT
jgi:hypothetical protein